LDLNHVADTVVGDENLRGISGGQKRRVTVGEMLTDRSCSFLGLENITDGLSSTDSFHLIQTLSRACRMMKMSAVVSLLQPSDEIVQMFDKLLVLTSQGELAYFGPVQRELLKHVFLQDDHDDKYAPLLLDTGSMCDLVLKHSGDVDREAAAMRRFTSHPIHQDMVQSISQIRANAPPARDRDIRVFLPNKKYSSSVWYQFQTIGARRMKLIARNAVTWTRIGIAIVFGIIIGSLFSQLNDDIMGSLARSGYMFLHCFLVLMLSAAITIPQTFRDRVTLFKHRSAEFYSGRVAYLTQVLLDMPLSILEAVILASISYYWVGMQSEANHFFFFLGTLIGLEFVGQAFGRLLCAVSRKQVSANSLSSVLILIFGTVASFMPSYNAIPGVLRWLSWVTPASYAFEGLMINEFTGRQINGVVIPGEDGDVELGKLTGETWIGTFGLPRAEWGSPTSIKTFDIFFLFMASIFVDMLGFYFVEKTKDWFYIQSRRPQRTAKSLDFEQFKSNEIEDSATTFKSSATSDARSSWPNSLVAKGLSYYVPIKSKSAPKQRFSIYSLLGPCLVKIAGKSQKDNESSSSVFEDQNELQLLQSVDVRFRRGRIAALMGTRYVKS
jgi:ABC-type multidrug transport system permease subunit